MKPIIPIATSSGISYSFENGHPVAGGAVFFCEAFVCRADVKSASENRNLTVDASWVRHPLWVSKGGGLDSNTIGNVEIEVPKTPTLAKTERMRHPAGSFAPTHPPGLDAPHSYANVFLLCH